jgi:fermentation-respiration switch protein FrsA (DUF1100 family)
MAWSRAALRSAGRRMLTVVLGLGVLLLVLAVLVRLTEPWLVYFPMRDLAGTPAASGLVYQDVDLRSGDGTRIHGWFLPGPLDSSPVILFLHGNAGNVSHRVEKLALLHEAGAGVLIIDYRGYGQSEGRPTERGLYLDARAGYTHLLGPRRVDPRRIVLYGESLGTAVAAELAAEHHVGGVILESAFTSATSVARELYRFLPIYFLMSSRFNTLGSVGRIDVPLLVLHSRDDEFFGMHHAQTLLAAARGPKRLVELRGGHNDAFIVSVAEYRAAIRAFLAEVGS